MARDSKDDGLSVQFFPHPLTGKDYVRISIPNNKNKEIVAPVESSNYRERFPQEWAEYQRARQATEGEVPLNMAPWIDGAMQKYLQSRDIHSVEQLADLDIDEILANPTAYPEDFNQFVLKAQKEVGLVDEEEEEAAA